MSSGDGYLSLFCCVGASSLLPKQARRDRVQRPPTVAVTNRGGDPNSPKRRVGRPLDPRPSRWGRRETDAAFVRSSLRCRWA